MADAQALLLQVSADTSKAEKRLKAFEDKLKGIGKTVDKISNDNQKPLARLFGNPAQAFDKIFDATRFKVLDTGAARIGLFGSSLEKLGVVGLGTAAAIGAVAFALNRAQAAIEFADKIGDTADRLHISTDALQEWRGALQLAGGEEANADGALEAFSITLGKAQAGLPKAIKGFKELGFTTEQIKSFSDTGDALTAVIAKIAGLQSSAQRDAVISQFGLDGLKQLIDKGPEGVARFTDEIRTSGGVMDKELIKRAGKLNDEIEKLNRKIKIDLHSSFVDLGPLLVDLLTTVARITGGIERFLAKLQPLRNRSDKDLQSERDDFTRQAFNAQTARGQKNAGNPFFINQAAKANAKAAEIKAEQDRRSAERAAEAQASKNKPTGTLIDLEAQKEAAAAAKKSADQLKHFNAELARAAEAILSANDDELHTLAQRQDIAIQRLKAEDAARLQAIDDEVATGAITKEQGERLKIAQHDVLIAKANQLIAEQLKAQRELLLKQEQGVASAMASYLDAQLGLASSAEDRADLESQILAAQRSIARKVLVEQLSDPNVTPLQRGLTLGLFDRTTGALESAQNAKRRAGILGDQLEVSQATLQSQVDAAQLADQLAETARDRRDAELKLLDLQYRAQKAQLEYIIATSQSVADIKKARIDLASLNASQAGQRQNILNNTRGPVEQFVAGLPLDPSKLNEALQNVATHGLQSLEDGLVSVIGHTKKLGDVFREVASQIVADLARIAIQRAIIGPLENVLSSVFGSVPGLGGVFGAGKAIGGPVFPGKAYPVGERGMEMFVPGVAGSIIPHSAVAEAARMGGGRSVTVLQTVQFDARGALMFKDYTLQQNRTMVSLAAAAAQQATRASLGGVSGALTQQQQHSA